jgi:hypothetical protein
MDTLLNFNDCFRWAGLLILSFRDSIFFTPCTIVERLIIDRITSVMIRYWSSCSFASMVIK